MKVLFLITARGGSKGVPRKNIRKIKGMPLIAYKIISALKTSTTKRVICSTDDLEIAEIAKQYGAEVPFMRPAHLAADEATSEDTILHAMSWLEEHGQAEYDFISLMEPSSPFATWRDIDAAIEKLMRHDADSVVGISPVKIPTVFVAPLGEDGRMNLHYEKAIGIQNSRRQDFVTEYAMNGAVYVAKWDFFKKYKGFLGPNTFGYIMPGEYGVEIDAMEDLNYATFLVENGYIDISFWR